MAKHESKRLRLGRETIKVLAATDLRGVGGGTSLSGWSTDAVVSLPGSRVGGRL